MNEAKDETGDNEVEESDQSSNPSTVYETTTVAYGAWAEGSGVKAVFVASVAFAVVNWDQINLLLADGEDVEQTCSPGCELLRWNVGPGPDNEVGDYLRWIVLIACLGLGEIWLENRVHAFAELTEREINERRAIDPLERPKVSHFFLVDMIILRILLVFFPSIRVQRLSFSQAARAAGFPRQTFRRDSKSMRIGVHLLNFHNDLIRTNAPLTLKLIHASTAVIIVSLATLATISLAEWGNGKVVAILNSAGILRLFVPLSSAANVIIADIMNRAGGECTDAFGVFARGVQGIFWLLTVMSVLSALGLDMSSYFTGLGISSIAAAFAAQTTLKELFSTVSLLADNPFSVGDTIVFKGVEGVVTKVGFRSTNLQTIYNGECMIVPNSDLAVGTIFNRTKMENRRVKSSFTLALDSEVESIASVASVVRDVVSGISEVEYISCHLMELSLNGYVFEYVYKVIGRDSVVFKNSQHQMNLGILRKLSDAKLKLSNPRLTPA